MHPTTRHNVKPLRNLLCHGVRGGFTLVEIVSVMAIIGVLSSLALPRLSDAIERARVAKAIGDLRTMAIELLSLDSLPPTLAGINRQTMVDPWGNPYQYLKFTCAGGGNGGGNGNGGNGGGCNTPGARKDRFLVPVNSMFDLYSMGKDGSSVPPFTAAASRDDVVMANDGGFYGLARNF
jgi:general secretion pathway protein G